MALQVEELAKHVLAETRVVTNGPVLKPDEPLRVDVVPGGAGGSQVLEDTVSFALNASYQVAPLRLSVGYKVYAKKKATDKTKPDTWDELKSGFQPLPIAGPATKKDAKAGGSPTPLADVPDTLLSIALLMAPKLKFGGKKSDRPIPPVVLPDLDRKLVVTLTVSSTALKDVTISRDIEIPFTVPTVDVPLPAPAVCVCTNGTIDVTGIHGASKYLVLAAPGSPEAVAELVATYNSVIEVVTAVQSVVSLLSVVVDPLKKVVELLEKVPIMEAYTGHEARDWDRFNNFDDEMRSFLLVAPTGYGIRFSDTVRPGDLDDTGDTSYKTYMAVDLLKLPEYKPEVFRTHMGDLLGLNLDKLAKLTELRKTLADLTGTPVNKVELGIGVIAVGDLGKTSLTSKVINYDKTESSDDDERLWEPSDGPDGDVESSKWIVP